MAWASPRPTERYPCAATDPLVLIRRPDPQAFPHRVSFRASLGYRVRFENRTGPNTRLEVLTEGILTRRLQHDPTTGLAIFDEFHERRRPIWG